MFSVMEGSTVIKQLEEKNVANEIDIMLWSDKMDLVAISNVKGEVALHRLSWSRVWCLSPYKEGIIVKAMAWKPDSKIIAIGYSTGRIILVNVENKTILHTDDINSEITFMLWSRKKTSNEVNKPQVEIEDQQEYVRDSGQSSTYLPELPPLTGFSSSNVPDDNITTFLQRQMDLNVLVVGTKKGQVFINIFGFLPYSIFDLAEKLGYHCSILNILMSEELNFMYITIKDSEENIRVVIVETTIFKTHSKELFVVATKYGTLNAVITYLSNTISIVKETWEAILFELDTKLLKYASQVPSGTLSVEFLDMLMLGIVSERMQEFLLNDLTKKGLAKLGQSIDNNYTNIQKLLLKNVSTVGQNITFLLSELRGLARFEYRYKVLSLHEDDITNALASNGSFLIKSSEIQQVINSCIFNYKAFFRWLYSIIMHLIEEPIPPEITKMAQQDMLHIVEFLKNFDNIGSGSSITDEGSNSGFVMEKVGQYLIDGPLTFPVNTETDWTTFLNKNPGLKKYSHIFKHRESTSLIQEFNLLTRSVEDIFSEFKASLCNHFNVVNIIYCSRPIGSSQVASINTNSASATIVFPLERPLGDVFYFLEILVEPVVKAMYGYFTFPSVNENAAKEYNENRHILDLHLYTSNTLSILTEENFSKRMFYFYQCPVAPIKDRLIPVNFKMELSEDFRVNTFTLDNICVKTIDGMNVSKFSISGYRKVAVMLSDNKRKVRIYEMEADDEEEEDTDMTNSTFRESDTSVQDNSDVD